MNLYTILSSGLGTQEATDLSGRLSAWHDAMVAHERRLRAGTTNDACDDECPHAEALALWPEAVARFGPRAQKLTFLKSRARERRHVTGAVRSPDVRAEAADHDRRRRPEASGQTAIPSSSASPGTPTESSP